MGRLIGCVDIMKKKGREKIIAEVWGVVPETKTLVYEVTRISYCHREVAYSLVYFEAPRRAPFGACTSNRTRADTCDMHDATTTCTQGHLIASLTSLPVSPFITFIPCLSHALFVMPFRRVPPPQPTFHQNSSFYCRRCCATSPRGSGRRTSPP